MLKLKTWSYREIRIKVPGWPNSQMWLITEVRISIAGVVRDVVDVQKHLPCVKHIGSSCIHYWIPAHRPPERTDPCAQTSKIQSRIFQLIPLRPRCLDATLPSAPAVVALALRNLPSGSTHNNTIYVAAVCPTGCYSHDLQEENLAKIMQVVRTKSVCVA